MGGILSRLGANAKCPWRSDRGAQLVDPDMEELQQHQYQAAVIEATDKGDVEMLTYLQEMACLLFWGGIDSIPANPPLLHRAMAKGRQAVVEYLLQQGLDVDLTDSSGMTVLHVACKAQMNSCLPPLIAKTRDIDRRDIWGRTPLIKALVYRNEEAARMLLDRGANPNACDLYGMTPLTTAIDYGMMDMLGVLVDHGADVNLISHHHHGKCSIPPLYLAINNQNLPMIQQLLRLGAATQPRVQDYCYYSNSNSNSGANTNTTASHTAWNYIGLGNNTNSNNNNPANNTPMNTNSNVNNYQTTSSLTPSLQHSNAVSLCMYELVRHGAEDISKALAESSPAIKILLEVLGAHGYPLGSAPDVLISVLLNNSLLYENISMLLYKLQLCSASATEDILLKLSLSQSQNPMADEQRGDGEGGDGEERRGEGERERMRRGRGANTANASNTYINQMLKKPPRLISSLQNQSRRVVRRALMDSGAHNVLWACGPLQCPPALKTLLLLKDVDRAFGNRGHRHCTTKGVS